MSFVALGGDGLRPTFFELVAAERLMPSLKAALIYSLSVAAQRRPALNRLLDREDELFFLVSVLLDRHALATTGGSFAEGLYGLRRASVADSGAGSGAAGTAAVLAGTAAVGDSGAGARPLTALQHQNSLILMTLVPFLRSRLDALYQRLTTQRQSQQWQPLAAPQPPADHPPGGVAGAAAALAGWQRRLQGAAAAAFVSGYPWVYAAHEGARFAYQLLYLLGRTPYYSPELHLLGLQVVRLTGQEAVQQERARQQHRAARLARLGPRPGATGGAWLWGLLRRSWVRAGHAAADHTRSALILSVFAFKLLEWWYSSAESKLGDQGALPPPPPPPALLPARGGLALPPNVTLCPLCRQPRTNPALLATSGYVFCYPCIFREVSERGQCPVTHVPARLEHVRRLYQGT